MSRRLITVVPLTVALVVVVVITLFSSAVRAGEDGWVQPEFVELLSKSEAARTIGDLSPEEFASLLQARNPMASAAADEFSLLESEADSETDSESEAEVEADLDEDADMEVDEDESANLMEVDSEGNPKRAPKTPTKSPPKTPKAPPVQVAPSDSDGGGGHTAGSAGTSAGSAGTSAGSAGTSAGSAGTSAGFGGKNAASAGTSAGSAGTSAGKSGGRIIVQPKPQAVRAIVPYKKQTHYPGDGADACYVFYSMYVRRYGFMDYFNKTAAQNLVDQFDRDALKFCTYHTHPDQANWIRAIQEWKKIMAHSGKPYMNQFASTASSSIAAQQQCGSCWAESAIGSFEVALKKANKFVGPLSVQQVIDCAVGPAYPESYGCKGGTPMDALRYLSTHGAALKNDYPYTGQQGKCREELGKNGPHTTGKGYDLLHFEPAVIKATKHDYSVCTTPNCDIQYQFELDIISSVERNGPFIVYVDASNWQGYTKGIFPPNQCSSTLEAGNHVVELLGYGQEGGIPYWLVRNSWGTSWGENGFIKLPIGQNACGIANYIVHSTVAGLDKLGGTVATAGKAGAGAAKLATHAPAKAPAKKKF